MISSTNFTEFDEEDGDEYDDFFFDSIKRYKTLQMFNVEKEPQRLFRFDDQSIVTVSKHNKGINSELLRLSLPIKLTLPPEDEGRSKGNDFKVMSGLCTKNLIHEVNVLENYKNFIITSENNTKDLNFYSFHDSSKGSKYEGPKSCATPLVTPSFTVLQESNTVICYKNSSESLFELDIDAGLKVKEISHPFSFDISNTSQVIEKNSYLKSIDCQCLDKNLISILNCYSGDLVLYDIRTDSNFIKLPSAKNKSENERWSVSGYDFNKSLPNYFGIVSNGYSFCVYDKRNNSMLIEQSSSVQPVECNNNLRFKFNEKESQFSLSGVDSFVYVYKLENTAFEHVFTHNGHCPSNSLSKIITDHIWLSLGYKEVIVSVCNNKTLNCWDFNENS